jgi:hypothetical protein
MKVNVYHTVKEVVITMSFEERDKLTNRLENQFDIEDPEEKIDPTTRLEDVLHFIMEDE